MLEYLYQVYSLTVLFINNTDRKQTKNDITKKLMCMRIYCYVMFYLIFTEKDIFP